MKKSRTAQGRDPAARAGKKPPPWKRPLPRAIVVFAVIVAGFYGLRVAPLFLEKVFDPYLRANANVSAWVLTVFGERASAQAAVVSGRRYQISISRGCDALEPSALFAAAVIAVPVVLRRKLLGLVVGVALLALLNLVRIISLYYTGVFFPDAFEVMHVDVWQPVFILCTVLLWIAWAWWALRAAPAGSSS